MAERTRFRANSPNLSSNKIRAAEIEAADKGVFPWTAVNALNVWEISLGFHSPRSWQGRVSWLQRKPLTTDSPRSPNSLEP